MHYSHDKPEIPLPECFFDWNYGNSFSTSTPNLDAHIPLNRENSYDSNDPTSNFIPILEAEIRNLPGFCLPILSGQRRRFRARIIYRRKGLLNWNTAPLRSWESAQWLWRYSGIKLDRIISWVWKAPSYFPHIFSSTLWNPIEFDIYGRLFSWGIQPFMYHSLKISFQEDIGNYQNCTWINLSILVCSKSDLSCPFVSPSPAYILLQFLAIESGIWVTLR